MVKGSSAGEPGVELDTHGMSLHQARSKTYLAASVNAKVCIGRGSRSPGVCLDIRSGFSTYGVASHRGPGCCPSPAPDSHWRTSIVQPAFCRGRYEGTALLLGRRG
jgi:hypothetical protein